MSENILTTNENTACTCINISRCHSIELIFIVSLASTKSMLYTVKLLYTCKSGTCGQTWMRSSDFLVNVLSYCVFGAILDAFSTYIGDQWTVETWLHTRTVFLFCPVITNVNGLNQ